jgi:hypothetical protein
VAIDFPNSPVLNEEFQVNGRTWKWNGSNWVAVGTSTGATGLQGIQGALGNLSTQGLQGFTGTTGLQGMSNSLQGFAGADGALGVQGTASSIQGRSGATTKLGMKTGWYYVEAFTSAGNSNPTLNRTNFIPFFVAATTTFTGIFCRTGTGFSGTAVIRLGMYNDSGGVPSTVAFDAGTVSCTAAATTYQITISQTVNAGTYWLASNVQTAATTNTFQTIGAGFATGWVTGLPYDTVNVYAGYYENSISGAFATAGTLVYGSSNTPGVGLKV